MSGRKLGVNAASHDGLSAKRVLQELKKLKLGDAAARLMFYLLQHQCKQLTLTTELKAGLILHHHAWPYF